MCIGVPCTPSQLPCSNWGPQLCVGVNNYQRHSSRECLVVMVAWGGMTSPRAQSGCSNEEEYPCLLLGVTSWQSVAAEEEEQGERNGSGVHG